MAPKHRKQTEATCSGIAGFNMLTYFILTMLGLVAIMVLSNQEP
jgi:hypothetical protein